jgi:hypothetical protein
LSPLAADPAASWASFARLVARIGHGADPDLVRSIELVRHPPLEHAESVARELRELYALVFDPDEVMDAGQQIVALAHGFHDTWLARGPDGRITAALQAKLADLDATRAALIVWYVAAAPGTRAPARELFTRALADSLDAARSAGRAVAAIVGETRPGVERTFNRYGLRRVFRASATGLAEVPYLVPNDDLSGIVSEHLLLTRLDERTELPVDELLALVAMLHHEYLRPEYYTLAALRASERHRGRPLPHAACQDEHSAAAYHRAFAAALAECRAELLRFVGEERSLLLLTEREHRSRPPRPAVAEGLA